MLKTLLTTTALGAVLATGAFAQETQPAPETDTAPVIENEAPATEIDPAVEPAEGEVTEGETLEEAPAEIVEDDAMPEIEDDAMTGEAGDDAVVPEAGAEETMTGDATDDAVEPDAMGASADREGWELEEGYERVDLATLSAETLIGSNIQNMEDETVATVDDVLMALDGTAVESIAASFGGFLGFGTNTVLLTLEEVDIVQDADGNVIVRTNLTPELLEGRPEYEGA